jgi:hypothetical protein
VNETFGPAAGQRVRDTIAQADRQRRRHVAAARSWRAAPFVAALCLIVAVLARSLQWPAAAAVVLLSCSLAGLLVYVLVNGRSRPISDRVAAAIDAHARCGGELRSANWFAAREDHTAWTDLHLDRAADRLEAIDWSNLYPPVRAVRTWIVTGVLVAATLAAPFMFPDRTAARANTPPAASGPPALRSNLDELPPELLQQLAELLEAADNGTLSADKTALTSSQVRELLARLNKLQDHQALKDLARKLEANRGLDDRADRQMKDLAARAKQAAAMSVESPEFRAAMDDLARNLNDAAAEEALKQQDRALASAEKTQPGEGGQTASASAIDEAAIQSVKEAAASATGGGVVTLSKDGSGTTATPGFGVGGSGGTGAQGRPTDLSRALRQEIVEASTDNPGDNVNAPVRRKTEQGQATTAFTHSAAGKSDRSRAAAPPDVPESRRIDVQRYFTRTQ